MSANRSQPGTYRYTSVTMDSNSAHHFVRVRLRRQAIDRIAHDQRRLCRIEDDDGLATIGAAHLLDRPRGRLRGLVDVGPRARPRGSARDRRHDLGIGDRRDAATMGMVACPPQVTRLTFSASRATSPLTAGTA